MNDRPASSVIVLATLCVLVLTCRNTSAPDPQAPVATMRSGTVYYRQIRCSPRLRTDPQRCTQIEQDNLNRRLYGLLIESAASQLGLQLTAEELAAIETHVRREHPGNVAAAGRMRALLKGVARIHRGESQSAVERELFPLGISREQLAEMATRYPTVADADEALAIDFVGTADKSVRQFYRRALLEPKLVAVLEQRAVEKHIAREVAEAQLWREVASQINLQIVDERYQMPDFVGILNRREAQVDVTP